MKNFNGKILFLNRSDINTDEIIPARYLTVINRAMLKPYLLEDLNIDGFSYPLDIKEKNVIITRANFGCGSSREHAPWALEANGINLVIGESFARIFKQNMFNCGLMAVELASEIIDKIFVLFSDSEAFIETDLEQNIFIIKDDKNIEKISFSISEFNNALVKAGGWLEYADSKY